MLTPEQLNQIPEHFVQQIQSLEDYIIADIARRVGKEGQFTATAVLQTEKALSLGADIEDIERLIQFVTGATLGDIDRTIREAIDSSISTDNVIYKGAGYDPIDLQRSPVLMDILESGIRQTKAEFQNLTATMGFATLSGGKEIFQDLTSFYHTTLNMAAMQVSTGVLSLDSAKRFAVKKMADSGLRYVDYATGHMNRVDVAVRRAILTGVNQLNLRLTDKIMENLGAEYVEVTATQVRGRPMQFGKVRFIMWAVQRTGMMILRRQPAMEPVRVSVVGTAGIATFRFFRGYQNEHILTSN